MPIYFCNPLLKSEKRTKQILNKYYNFILTNNIILRNTYVNIYYDIQCSDGINYVNKIKRNAIFISASKMNISSNFTNYYFITNNSWNPQFSYTKSISNSKISEYQKIFTFEDNYKINKDGFILIILNNSYGWFKKNCKITYKKDRTNYFQMLNNLVSQIRKHTNRKIVLRLHPKDRNHKLEFYMKKMNLDYEIDNETEMTDLINNTYCVFIQNTKLILDFVNKGIPIFNLNFYNMNYFPEIQIKDISKIEELDKIELPNRQKFIKRFYSFITFDIDRILIYIYKKFQFMF